ncbi:MAG: hypothetical protein JWM68_520, partial [Verrucomicrobiales bacterium]|nr:hypothetical protein [Verrucomicrobiales bacterium]
APLWRDGKVDHDALYSLFQSVFLRFSRPAPVSRKKNSENERNAPLSGRRKSGNERDGPTFPSQKIGLFA